MRALVTGSAGHLGEALVRFLRGLGHQVEGLDRREGPFTSRLGSISERRCLADCLRGVEWVFHTASLHRPHIDTRSRQEFVETNIGGTLNLLEGAAAAGVRSFVLTSTTSVFGDALVPPAGAPAAWITEDVGPIPKNIYGVTKAGAEDLCALFHRNHGLPCVVLRTSRFFPEPDLDPEERAAFADDNIKVSEFLYRRVDLEDVATANLAAAERAPAIGFGRYIVSATTPFLPEDLPDLRRDPRLAIDLRVPGWEEEYRRRGWRMVPVIDRVYVNARARRELGWLPRWDFSFLIERLRSGEEWRSPLARRVGSKGYR